MTRKAAKPQEPNVRDQLTTAFVEELQRDFAEHGKEIIETVRRESPSKYAELVLRLIPLEPRMIETANAGPQNSQQIADRLLADIGLVMPDDDDRAQALALYDELIHGLEDIRNQALQ